MPSEQQLRDTEERYRLVFENARVGMAVAGPDGRYFRVNRRFAEMIGYQPEELLDRSVSDISHPDDAGISTEPFARLARGESDFEEYERRYIHKSGTTVQAVVSLSAARNPDGSVAYAIAVVEDVTENRMADLRHAAMARLGIIGLSNAGLPFLFERAAETVRDLLDAASCEVHKASGSGEMTIAVTAGTRDESLMALSRFAIVSDAAVHVTSDAAPRPLAAGAEPGLTDRIAVVIAATGEQRWGTLSVALGSRRNVPLAVVDFLRALAALLGQAIERRRAEVELRIRALQQSSIVEVGRITSASVTPQTLDRVCELVMQGLAVEQAMFLRQSESGELQLPEGDDERRLAAVHAGAGSADSRPSTFRDGRISGIIAPVALGEHRFGVCCAYTTLARDFTSGDLEFVESVAWVVAEALERQVAHELIFESERRYRNVVEGSSEIIFSVSGTGEILGFNHAFEVATGWRPEEWIGRHFQELLAEEDRAPMFEVFHSMHQEPRHIRLQTRIKGRQRPVVIDVAASPRIVDGQVVEIYGFARDITEEQLLRSRLEQANRLASLGKLAATVAHEFNNVLMGISPFTELLRREYASERGVTAVDQIVRSVKRGKRITEDILRFAQPGEPALAPMNVASWLDSLALEARSLIGSKYDVVAATDGDLRVAADAHQMHQTFINLILNARDAMPGGGTVRLLARRENAGSRFEFGFVETPDAFVHFMVQDTGVGISSEAIDHVFEPLFTTKRTGTGLGLSVARQVVTRHGGEIFVESKPGKGTTFHLFIPQARPSPTAPAQISSGRHQPRRLLLVEDEGGVAEGLSALLTLEGFEVDVVGTGAEVLPALARSRPDAVILDIGLPDIEGTLVYRAIAREYPDLPVVFSSGHGDATKLEAFLLRPNVEFLLKPYDLAALIAKLNEVGVGYTVRA